MALARHERLGEGLGQHRSVQVLPREPLRVHRGLGQRRRVSDMVTMTVAHQDQIDLAQRLKIFVFRRRQRILQQPGIGDDDLAARGGNTERGLPQPQHFGLAGLRHRGRRPGNSKQQQQADDASFHNLSL